jgi:hypothetical protein
MRNAIGGDNLRLLSAIVIALLAGVVALVIMAVVQWRFDLPTPTALAAAQAPADPSEYHQLRDQQLETLKSCRWLDKSKGAVSLPIERAMDLIIRESAAKSEPRLPRRGQNGAERNL